MATYGTLPDYLQTQLQRVKDAATDRAAAILADPTLAAKYNVDPTYLTVPDVIQAITAAKTELDQRIATSTTAAQAAQATTRSGASNWKPIAAYAAIGLVVYFIWKKY